jgi:methyltransferase
MLTRYFFVGIIATIILQRLFELRVSKRNTAYVLFQGGQEHGDNLLGLVKILQVSWWIAMITEVWLLERPFFPALAAIAAIGVLTGQILRYFSMQALEWRWTLPIMTVSGIPVIQKGVYRYLRHPNWLGVILEISALPLIHTAYLTATIFALANGILMSMRIKTEERALNENTNYASAFADKPRFLPVFGLTGKANSF